MNLPFIDLKKQYARLENDIKTAVDKVLASGRFIMGPEVNELETKLADYTGARNVISCSSGTDALLMPLMAHGVGPGDAVFTSPFTFIATAEVISLVGATPVFVDIDPRTYNMDPQKLTDAVERVASEGGLRPACVIPVDLFGLPADYTQINKIAEEKKMFVLEDAAQGFGGQYAGRKACNLAPAAATSFFPAKPLGCYGDGGATFVEDDELAEKMKSIRVHGQGSNKYDNIRIGLNARMDTIQAAILLVKLGVFPDEVQERQRVANRYTENLKNHVVTPEVPDGYLSGWAQYSVQTDDREKVINALSAAGVPTAIYYPKPLHLQDAFASLNYKKGDFPTTEKIAERIFSLPMHPYLENDQIDFISEKLIAAL